MVRQILKEYHVKGGKMDQHFLVDAAALDEIVESAQLEPSDIVLEIGGGIGNLSERIAPRVSKLIIIELDPQMIHVLKSRLSVYENIVIIPGNVMDIDFSELNFNKIVANLPYSISSDVTLKFLQHDFDLAVLMYQYEFAQRLTAAPGGKEYGRLSVHVQHKTEASFVLKVPKESFEPAPKVDSAVIRLVPRTASYAVADEDFFFSVTKALFSQRRKKIKNTLLGSPLNSEIAGLKGVLNNLEALLIESDAPVSEALLNKTVGGLLSMRAEELSPADIAYFSNLLYSKSGKNSEGQA
ncbi:Ribosomal RNA small subunit methyltransferase A [Methanimicrococcus sp. At1]|uniref:Probable ribosomal RNA small subunit methyltransferase A n=1 Tax=Methanimicrococcus hacksteinii TaxID=3028293 RepID=A0ABU3VRI2_9EURY|nr:16S rRNA (adenine(1518)-N(6)/adenine(1519)-N(6))-dimethyltransferase RsmA [Methanimicrococcus sp. At1]MDV0446006.1 Ribosomal RNA small subunit methyltransferase A [Methanimicrococcus sp. At1]